jgi:hypothetical protein
MLKPPSGNLWDAPAPILPTVEGKPKRHKWIKLKVHVYLCRVCGLVKEHREDEGWRTKYHLPDGTAHYFDSTPPCVNGEKTDERLKKYEIEIRVHNDPKTPHVYRPASDFNKNCSLCSLLKDDPGSAHVEAAP